MSQKRAIFAQVDENTPKHTAPKTSLIDRDTKAWRAMARAWLLILAALILAIIVVGGLTRLTDSGLSITQWLPLRGALPPLNAQDWAEAFAKYQEIPEFSLVNADMTLAEFKVIYWWEWGHRQLGRVLGLVWFIGFIWLVLRHRIGRVWVQRFLLLGALGGLQGAIGWWMVSSGLTGRMVDVASYRLAIHLGMACFILALIWGYALRLYHSDVALLQAKRNADLPMHYSARIFLIGVFAQIILGALVAGIDAGQGYRDWPLMNGALIPPEIFDYTPWWSNLFENPALVQLNHRMLAYGIALFSLWFWLRTRKHAYRVIRQNGHIVLMLLIAQILLGIITLRLGAPLSWAIAHQILAILLLGALVKACFNAKYPMQSIR